MIETKIIWDLQKKLTFDVLALLSRANDLMAVLPGFDPDEDPNMLKSFLIQSLICSFIGDLMRALGTPPEPHTVRTVLDVSMKQWTDILRPLLEQSAADFQKKAARKSK